MNSDMKDLVETWHVLMRDKEIYSKTVYTRILKEEISAEDLKRHEVSYSAKKYGYYDLGH
jgi:nicotinamide mononucleotide adenylyltransferase